MMNFRTVTAAIQTILGDAAAGRFSVIGYRRQGRDAEEIRGDKRSVQVYFSSGDFPKSAGRSSGSTQHQMTFNVDLSVSAPAKVNLAAITTPGATAGQIATALSALQEAADIADEAMDELMEMVYQILMDARNFDLGLDRGIVSSRWVGSLNKDDPQPQGSLVVLTGRIQYTCQTVEAIVGEIGVAATGGISTVIDIIGDDVERTGVDAAPEIALYFEDGSTILLDDGTPVIG